MYIMKITESLTHLIVISIFLNSIAFIPFLIQVRKTQNADCIPYSSLTIMLIASCIALSLALYIRAWLYSLPYAISFITIGMLVYYKHIYR
jgi:uncharacterized protein with PQ loop repeat